MVMMGQQGDAASNRDVTGSQPGVHHAGEDAEEGLHDGADRASTTAFMGDSKVTKYRPMVTIPVRIIRAK